MGSGLVLQHSHHNQCPLSKVRAWGQIWTCEILKGIDLETRERPSVAGSVEFGPARTLCASSAGALTHARNYLFAKHILFTRSDLTQSFRQLLLNLPPMVDGEKPENPRLTIQFVNDAKSSDFEAPESR
jgi:hypothetical protein